MRGLLPPDATSTGDIRVDTAAHLGLPSDSKVLQDLEWLGLFSNTPLKASKGKISPLDLLTEAMLERMQYTEGERDLIILAHHFEASYPNKPKEQISSTLIAYGEPGGYSAMARTVSLPAAIAIDLILQGEIKAKGVQTPVTPELYKPILAGLSDLGIEPVEQVKTQP
jgi:saccharopine dehydrogenase (NADP+, L-glutamate forming)